MDRRQMLAKIEAAFEVTPIVAILGPRQTGKTTLAKHYIEQIGNIPPQNYFDLEDSRDLARLHDPMLALSGLQGLIVIDEVQYMPALFPTLRVLIDKHAEHQRYLILGSASGALFNASAETLAGRISYVELTPFSVSETQETTTLWTRGGFPRSYLAKTDQNSYAWRKTFIDTFLKQDIPQLGISVPFENLRSFWAMLSHYHGGILNSAELACALQASNKTITHYTDILCSTFMIRLLKPWHVNIAKRQVKSPKLFIRDSGILHALLGINDQSALAVHPKLGASWEGFALEEIIRKHEAYTDEAYFWATHQGAELDLLILKDNQRLGFEIKHSAAPKLTKSMRIAAEELQLDSLTVIYPGTIAYPLTENIHAIPLQQYLLEAHT